MTIGLQQVSPEVIKKPNLKIFLSLILRISRHLRVVGDSMLPTINDGDLIIYKPINCTLKEGQIVVLNSPQKINTLLIKRVHIINYLGVDLRGDNEFSSIDSRHFGLISQKEIIGVVEKVIPN